MVLSVVGDTCNRGVGQAFQERRSYSDNYGSLYKAPEYLLRSFSDDILSYNKKSTKWQLSYL
jgi:hypothetical protein